MLGLLLLFLFAGVVYLMWPRRAAFNNYRDYRVGGARNVGAAERLERLKGSVRPEPRREPVFDPTSLLENERCEVCSSSPRVQFVHSEAGKLEFCGHHATKKDKALLAQGFTIAIDGRG